jgi:predicted phage terminase large subunit-like protein
MENIREAEHGGFFHKEREVNMGDITSKSGIYDHLIHGLELEKRSRKKNEECFNWLKQARENQKIPKGDWLFWLILAGRGFGKTRTGSETVRSWVKMGYRRIALVGHTHAEARQVMVEGVSGILSVYPHYDKPIYEPSKRQIIWKHGAIAQIFSAESPEQLRGPQFDAAWIDEFAKFHEPDAVLDQLLFGLRLGKKPKLVITTTPKTSSSLKKLIVRKDCVVTSGTTFDNKQNLSSEFLKAVDEKYGKTRMGAQELLGQMIEEDQTILWQPNDILHASTEQAKRIMYNLQNLSSGRIALALDPAMSNSEESDETGIIVAYMDCDGHFYVLEDLSLKAKVQDWSRVVVDAAHSYNVETVVVEVNQGGELIANVLRTAGLRKSIKSVRASFSKAARALPIAMLYQQGRVTHVHRMPKLEEQMLNFPGECNERSPDRVDALVWCLSYLSSLKDVSKPLFVWGL